MHGKTQCFAGGLLSDAGDLKHNAARFYHGYPVLQGAFSGTHTGLSRFCGYRFVREDLDPDFTATLDITGHGYTGSLDLVGFDPAGLSGYQAELSVVNCIASQAFPLMEPRNCLRRFTLLGINIIIYRSLPLFLWQEVPRRCRPMLLRQLCRRWCLPQRNIVNISTKCLQRNGSLAVELGTGPYPRPQGVRIRRS